MKKGIKDFFKNYRQEIIIGGIWGLLAIVAIPWLLEYLIYRNSYVSVLSNETWSGFLGSYLGGIIGGLFTLLAVYFTTKQTRLIQSKIEQQQAQDRLNFEKKEREKYVNSIYEYTGKFLTNITTFYYNTQYHANKESYIEETEKKLKICEDKLMSLYKSIEGISIPGNGLYTKTQQEIDTANLERIVYNRRLDNLNESINRHPADRSIAIECLNILKLLLNSNNDAEKLLNKITSIHDDLHFKKDYKWIESEREELIKLANDFGYIYINQVRENNTP